jgi:hypothetical protein
MSFPARGPAALFAVASSAFFALQPVVVRALSWGDETNVSLTATDSETGLTHRALLLDAAGTLHVTWCERGAPNQNYRIETRRWNGSSWSAPETIVDYLASDPGSNGGAKYPSLVEAANGDLHLFWHDYRVAGINNVEIFTKARPSGGVWNPDRSADIRLTTTNHPETMGDNGYVPVAVASSDGAVHVAWYDFRYDGSAAEILSKTKPAVGSWDVQPGDDADERVTTDLDNSELVDVDADAAGALHAVWRSLGSGARVRYARRDPSTGTWSTPIDVDTASQASGAPAAAVAANGSVQVVWPDSRDGGRALWTRTREANGAWGAETRLTAPSHGADEPAVTVDEEGTTHLVWHDGRVSLLNREVFYRARPSGAPWDTTTANDIRISDASGASVRPSIAARGGRVAVLWKDARTGNNDIFVRIGGPVGTSVTVLSGAEESLHASPNPVRAGVVRISGAAPGPLRVFDVAGRRIRTLPPGSDALRWNLQSESGERVRPGVYFVRDAAARTVRLTVLP